MKGYCNGCGKCCEALHTAVSPDDLAKHRVAHPEETGREGDFAFASIHFHSISNEEAVRRNPVLGLFLEAYHSDGESDFEPRFFYECDLYDKDTKRCTDHANRPHVCREYPYYGKELTYGEIFYDPDCPYIDDAPPTTKQKWMAIREELSK